MQAFSDHTHTQNGKRRRKPILLQYRASTTYLLITVSIAMFVNMLSYSIIVPIIPFMLDAIERGVPVSAGPGSSQDTLQHSGETSKRTGIMLGLFAAGLLVGSPIFGYMGDRIKQRKIPMLIGISGMIGATLIFIFVDKFGLYLLARGLQGIADSSVWTLGMALVADAFPSEQLGVEMSKVLLCYSIGLVVGAPVGALYQHLGYRAPFILCVALGAIDFLLRLLMVERDNCPKEWFEDEQKEDQNIKSKLDQVSIASTARTETNEKGTTLTDDKKNTVSTLHLLRQPRMLAAILLAFANGIVYNVFEPTLTVRLSTEWGLNSSQIGLVFLAQMIPTFISTPFTGYISDRFGPKVVCVTLMPLCALFVILMGTQNKNSPGGIAPLIVLFALQGFTAFGFLTPALPEIAHVAQTEGAKYGGDSGTGRGYSFFNIAFGLGALIGPLLGGYLFSTIGFFYLCVVIACFLFACVPFIFFYIGEPGKFIDRRAKAVTLKSRA